jgi:hypothetical protein
MTEMDMLPAALAELAAARRRDRVFGSELSLDPGWDILLTLFVREGTAGSPDLPDQATAVRLPASTTLRWIRALVALGLVDAHGSAAIGGLEDVGLTERGRSGLRTYFAAG